MAPNAAQLGKREVSGKPLVGKRSARSAPL